MNYVKKNNFKFDYENNSTPKNNKKKDCSKYNNELTQQEFKEHLKMTCSIIIDDICDHF